jgi:hypothetical protein
MFDTWNSFRHTQLRFHSVNVATIYDNMSGHSLLDFSDIKIKFLMCVDSVDVCCPFIRIEKYLP